MGNTSSCLDDTLSLRLTSKMSEKRAHKIINKTVKDIKTTNRDRNVWLLGAVVATISIVSPLNYVALVYWPAKGFYWALIPAVAGFGVLVPALLVDISVKSGSDRRQLKIIASEFKSRSNALSNQEEVMSKQPSTSRKSLQEYIRKARRDISSQARIASMWFLDLCILSSFAVANAWATNKIHLSAFLAFAYPCASMLLIAIAIFKWL